MPHLFTMREYQRDFKGRAIVLTAIEDRVELCTVKAWVKGPTPSDGMIRFLNDELFLDGRVPGECHLCLCEPMNRTSITFDYLRDYCVNTNTWVIIVHLMTQHTSRVSTLAWNVWLSYLVLKKRMEISKQNPQVFLFHYCYAKQALYRDHPLLTLHIEADRTR